MKRAFAFLLALTMVLSVLPASVLATDAPADAPVTETAIVEETPVAETPVELLDAAPDGAYTRIEAARLLADVLGLKYRDEMAGFAYDDLSVDTEDGKIAAMMSYYSIMQNGAGSYYGNFGPEEAIKRYDMAMCLNRALPLAYGTVEIPDAIPVEHPFGWSVVNVVDAGLMSLDENGKFNPTEPTAYGDVDLDRLYDLCRPSAKLGEDCLTITCNNRTRVVELELYFSATEDGKFRCVDDIDSRDREENWDGNTFTWIPSGATFAEHGEGWYYAKDSNGRQSNKVYFAYAEDAVQLAAPSVELNTDTLEVSWQCDNPVLAVIVQVQGDTQEILDYRRVPDNSIKVTELLPRNAEDGVYIIGLCAYSADDYVNNKPSGFVSVEYSHGDVTGDTAAPLTRLDAVYLLVDALGLEYSAKNMADITFPDVTDTDDAEAVATAVYYDFISGDQQGNFNPDGNLTRAQLATILTRALLLPDGEGQPSDVTGSEWYVTAVNAALDAGVMRVDANGDFNPDDLATKDCIVMNKLEALTAPMTRFYWDTRITPNGNLSEEVGVLAFNATPGEKYRLAYYRVNPNGGADIMVWDKPTTTTGQASGYANANMFSAPHYNENFITGTYYVEITAVLPDESFGATVKSPTWDYVNPGIEFAVSNPRWDANGNPVWDSANIVDAYLQKYAVEVYFNATSDDPSHAQRVGMFKVYAGDTAPYPDFAQMVDDHGPGWYFFEVRAESKNVNLALGSDFTQLSPALEYNVGELPQLPQLPTPINPRWHVDYDNQWDRQTGQLVSQTPVERKGMMAFTRATNQDGSFADQGKYEFELYRIENDQHVKVSSPNMGIGRNNPRTHLAFPSFIYDDFSSSTYYFKVRSVGDGVKYADSEWATSATWDYTAPTQKLDAPSTLFWDTETDFTADRLADVASVWKPVDNAAYYFIQYYWAETVDGSLKYLGGSQEITGYPGDDVYELLSDNLFAQKGEGVYYFEVQAVPADITQYRISDWSDKSQGCHLTSVLPTIDPAAELDWHVGYNRDGSTYRQTGLMSFTGTIPNEPPFVDYEIELFREADGDDISLGTVEYSLWKSEAGATVDAFAYFADKMETGTYYFTVTAQPENGWHSGSSTVRSPKWPYTRPDSKLQVSNPVINGNLSVSFDYDVDLDWLDHYEVEFSYTKNGEKPTSNSPRWGYWHTHDGPPLYVLDDMLANCGAGYYFVRIRAISAAPEKCVPSQWTDWSAPVSYSEPTISFEVSNPVWDGSTPTWEDNYLPDEPLLYWQIRYYYGTTPETINYQQCVWDTTYDRLPVQIPQQMIAQNGAGYYTFKVNVVSSDLSKVKSSGWSEASAPRYFEGLPQLGTPTDLKWHVDYEKNWEEGKCVSETPFTRMGAISFTRPMKNDEFLDQAHFDIHIYNADTGKLVHQSSRGLGSTSTETFVVDTSFIYKDLPSGTYYFKVRCRADGNNYTDGDWVDSRDFGAQGVFAYTQPTKRLSAPTGLYWDDYSYQDWETNKPQITSLWSHVDNAAYYFSEHYWAEDESSAKQRLSGTLDNRDEDGMLPSDRLHNKDIAEHGEGLYYFRVQAVPADITQYRISEWSDFSAPYDLDLTVDKVNDRLDDIDTTTASAADIQEAVAEIDHLDKAMAADAATGSTDTLNKLAALEQSVMSELKIIPETDVDDDIFSPALANKITVANMALNVDIDKVDKSVETPVTLTISGADVNKPATPEELIPTQYNNTLMFKMDIPEAKDKDGDESNGKQLQIPVQITLPIPGNINPNFLVILHHKSDGTWEELRLPHIFKDDGQWYATFNVYEFSYYALSQKAPSAVADGNTVTVNAHLPTNGVQTQYLCVVYSKQGQMLGMGMLQPQSDEALIITLEQAVPEGATMMIFAPDVGNGWAVSSAPAPVTIQ